MGNVILVTTCCHKDWFRNEKKIVWLTLFPLVGVLISITFPSSEFLDQVPRLSYGRPV